MVQRVQEAFARSVLTLSPSAINTLGPGKTGLPPVIGISSPPGLVATERVNEIIMQANITAYDRQTEIGLSGSEFPS